MTTADPARKQPPPHGRRTGAGADLIEPADPHDVADLLIALSRRRSRIQYELCRLLAAYDLSGHWAFTGAATCSRWAATNLEVETGTAAEWLRVGHALRKLPDIDAAFADGTLSYAKVRTLTRIAVDHPDRQIELIELARATTAASLPWDLARWTNTEESDGERDARHRREMGLSVRTEPDGAVVITARVPPLAGAAAMAAIDHSVRAASSGTDEHTDPTQSGSNPTAGGSSPQGVAAPWRRSARRRPPLAQRRALAFVRLLTTPSDGDRIRSGVQAELVIHLRADGATLEDGTPVAGHLVERLAPTAFFRALIHDAERRPINASGRQRLPTTRQKRVVAERDGYTCTRDGCDNTEFLEFDHSPDWDTTRRTVIDELRLLCSTDHAKRAKAVRYD